MNLDLEPGDFVINPLNKSWGIGQIQSIIKNKATVNFENKGKLVINIEEIILKKVKILNINELKNLTESLLETFLNAGQKAIELRNKGLKTTFKS